ncbi:Establishment of cohesion 1 [Halocaridina rubra]|uniref:Establishment of cohesion 1 n=1 Tax=Halocaridina rubra TaxID=373956 RepID=A0AAN8XE68_HALRR
MLKLAARKGDITLKQREGVFEKKNIGRVIEKELDKIPSKVSVPKSLPKPSPLPSVIANPRPVPTRVCGTPSPPKRFPSPRKTKKLFLSGDQNQIKELDRAGSLIMLCEVLKVYINDRETDNCHPSQSRALNCTPRRTSPRKQNGFSSPSRTSPLKHDKLYSPIRRSPRKLGASSHIPNERNETRFSSVRSPRRLVLSPSKVQTISPGKNSRRNWGASSHILNEQTETISPSRRSPKKLVLSPSKVQTKSPSKKSQRKWSDSSHVLNKLIETRSPVRRSPRKHVYSPGKVQSDSPSKKCSNITPRKVSLQKSKTCVADSVSVSEIMPNSHESGITCVVRDELSQRKTSHITFSSQNNDSDALPSKVYPIFDPKRWRFDKSPSPKKAKCDAKYIGNHKSKSESSQMIIDAGQKEFGVRVCKECGMVYEIANQKDEEYHKEFHNLINDSLRFLGWKKENQVSHLDEYGGRIIMIRSTDPPHCWRKVDDVLKVIDGELGFSDIAIPPVKEKTWVFFYILQKKVVGCVIGETIDKANRVIPSQKIEDSKNWLLCCSTDQVSAFVGISRLWVLGSERGKGIATKLVDILRFNMFGLYVLSKDDIAFSDPTESGAKFAEKYTARPDFLVYRRVIES